jgi:CheY-like chemotaxis protein
MMRMRVLRHPMKIIALTADARPELRDELMRDGIDCYVTKPVSLWQMGRRLRGCLQPRSSPLLLRYPSTTRSNGNGV